jgi:magnesium transporter
MKTVQPEGLQKDSRRRVQAPHRSPVGAPPGTLVADPNAIRSALSLTVISPEECKFLTDVTLADVERVCGEWPVVWLDCVGLADIELISDIGRIFGLHTLALEDTVNTGQRAKVDFFEDHAFVILRMIDDAAEHRYEQISIFFGENFVITFQERRGDPFNPVRKRIEVSNPSRLRSRKADYLAYALIDSIIDSFFAPVEEINEKIDAIEEEMIRQPQKGQVRRLHELRRNVISLKGSLFPVRDAIAGLVRAEVPFVRAETKIYFNDTLDHTISLIQMVETQRDMLTGLMDMHLSLSQARTNEIISFLTIVSSIFIPLTFIVGVWGMNFDPHSSPWNMPELEAYYGYPVALGFMALIALGLVAYFRWKKWL